MWKGALLVIHSTSNWTSRFVVLLSDCKKKTTTTTIDCKKQGGEVPPASSPKSPSELWSHLQVEFCLLHPLLYCPWLLNHHFPKGHAKYLPSYKISLRRQRTICLCLDMNAEIYCEIRASSPCFQTRVSSYDYG